MLNDGADAAFAIHKRTPIPSWIVQTRRQQRDVSATAAMGADELIDGFGLYLVIYKI